MGSVVAHLGVGSSPGPAWRRSFGVAAGVLIFRAGCHAGQLLPFAPMPFTTACPAWGVGLAGQGKEIEELL